ncbi:MAG: T9SS type A sorting domain-containing protein [Flavobacteriaceae bacterium]|nr:T9SS type A sorting domain-containing protein [Flavobacteriaceae bacterium]
MKKFKIMIVSAAMFAAVTGLQAQKSPLDFETPGNGAAFTWTTFENDANPAVEIVANPNSSGLNVSATVAKFKAMKAGQPWAGFESKHGSDIGTFTFSASNCIIKLLVWKSVKSDVGIKFASASNASTGEIKVANTTTGAWEELVFDFSARIGESNDQIILFPDFATTPARSSDNICYIDNIRFEGKGPALDVPMVAAPMPKAAASDVISMFSKPYTDVAVNTWRTDWSAGTLSDVTIAGDATKKYSSLDFVGVEATGVNAINASGMSFFNVDAWTPNMTQFRIKWVDFGADNAYGGGDDSEHEVSFSNPTQKAWNSYKIPMSDFTGLKSSSHLSQLIFSGTPTGSGVIYIDNVYFNKTSAVGIQSNVKSVVKLYPNPSNSTLVVSCETAMDEIVIYSSTGMVVMTLNNVKSNQSIDISGLAQGIYHVSIKTGSILSGVQLLVQ